MTNKNEQTKVLQKLTVLDIAKKNNVLDAKEDFLIAIGDEDYKITHDVLFRKTKQQKVLEDMVKFFNEIDSFNAELLELVTPYTSLLVIKHFTDLDVPDEIDEAMDLLTALIDLEVLGTIIGALPQDQVVKVFELLTKTIDNIKNNVEEAEAEALALSAEADAEIEATEKEDEVDGDKSE